MSNRTIKRILFVIALFVFLTIVRLLFTEEISLFDSKVYSVVHKMESEKATLFFKGLSFLCSTYFILLCCVLLFVFVKNKKIGFYASLNIGICYLLNVGTKQIFGRARPLGINLIEETGYSFPSGHSMGSMAFFGFILYILLHTPISKKIKWIVGVSFPVLIFFIGVSRIYLGVHYASDVLAGFSFALAYLLLYISIVYPKIGF